MIRAIYKTLFPEHLRNDISYTLGKEVYRPVKKLDGKKVIFVHIPKTGGTSIGPLLGFKETYHYSFDNEGRKIVNQGFSEKGTLQHRDCKELTKLVGPKTWKEAFKFSIIRNPWDRVYSWYKYNIKINNHNMQVDEIDFDTWVTECFRDKSRRYWNSDRLFQSQFDFLSNEEGDLAVDFVGRFETLYQEIEHVKTIIPLKGELKHLNKTHRDDYRSAYSELSKKIIEDLYAKDIEYWNYQF